MGFFSFLSRKSHDKGKSGNALKSQKYSLTSSGTLPVQGPYPVAGNGPNLLETLTRTRPEFGQTNSSLTADHDDEPAPAPAVPRFREECLERPSTAPNSSNSGPSWNSYSSRLKKGSSRGAPPVSFRMFKGGSVAQEVRPSSRGTEKTTSLLQPATPSLTIGHSRTNSIRSDNGRGFKDILDAQSEINPADFRTRVRAAGARDYGEDVADRNLGQNGFNLEAPQVQAFYAQSSSNNTPAFPRASKSEYPLGLAERRASTYSTGSRTRSLTSSTQFPILTKLGAQSTPMRSLQFPEAAPLFALDSTASETTKDSRRRQTLNTFISPPQARGEEGSHSVDRTARFLPSGKRRDSSVRPPTPSEHLAKITCPNNVPSILLNEPLVTKEGPFRPPVFPRDSVVLAKERADKSASDDVADEANFSSGHRSRKERSFSLRSASVYSARGLVASAAAIGLPRKRHSLHTLQSYVSSPVACHEAPIETSPSPPLATTREQSPPPPARPSAANSKRDDQDEMRLIIPSIPIEGAAPSASPGYSTPLETPAQDQDTTTRGGSSSPVHTETETKTRSVRALSASSATATVATVSDASSNPFHRPHSRHTANTSVDLSAPSLKTMSRTSLHTAPLIIEATVPDLPANLTTTTSTVPDSPTGSTTNFNIDDYLSSDDDSITGGSRRPRGEGEEDLLFSDSGYGVDGMQLPGLFDSLALTSASRQSSQQRLQHHVSSSTSFSPPRSSHGRGGSGSGRAMIYTGDSFGRAAGRRFIIDTGADDYDEDYEHGDEYEIDENESDCYSDAVAYPVEEEDDDDADSLYNNGERRQESRAGILSPPLLQPSRVINRLSAIIHPYHLQHPNNSRPVTPKDTVSTTSISRPRSAHSRESPRRNQPQYAETEVIEEIEERGKPATITSPNTHAEASTTISTKEVPPITTTTAIGPGPGTGTGPQETTLTVQEPENKPEPEVKNPDLVYKVSDISAAIKQRKLTKARNRVSGVPATGASKMMAAKTAKSKRWSIATSITSSVSGAVPVPVSVSASSKNSNNEEGAAAGTAGGGRNSRSVSVSSATSSIRGRRRRDSNAATAVAAAAVKSVKGMKSVDVSMSVNERVVDGKGKGVVRVGVHEVGCLRSGEERQRATTTKKSQGGNECEADGVLF